jgi:preprotein translocase SecE subunit
VARDRKRRGRRQDDGARSADDVARDIGLGPDDDAVGSPLGEGTAAPDPLRNTSADVDEARLAEAGLTPPGDESGAEIYPDELSDDDDREHAPDAVQGDAVRRRRAGHVEPEHRRSRGRLLTFFGHCIDELRRVQWPNRRHVGQATAVVLGFVVIAGGYLGLLDQVWQPLIEAIL